MKYITVTLISFLLSAQLFAQSYKPIDQGSAIGFTIKNLGINTKGSFTGLDGYISFSPANPSKDSFDVSIDAASVNTDNSMRDDHLKKESYFDVEKYPRIRMVSTSITG